MRLFPLSFIMMKNRKKKSYIQKLTKMNKLRCHATMSTNGKSIDEKKYMEYMKRKVQTNLAALPATKKFSKWNYSKRVNPQRTKNKELRMKMKIQKERKCERFPI
jgi:Tfp pilus assembly protein PilP